MLNSRMPFNIQQQQTCRLPGGKSWHLGKEEELPVGLRWQATDICEGYRTTLADRRKPKVQTYTPDFVSYFQQQCGCDCGFSLGLCQQSVGWNSSGPVRFALHLPL